MTEKVFPLKGSVRVGYTRGGSVVIDGTVHIGRFSLEAGHPAYPEGMSIVIRQGI